MFKKISQFVPFVVLAALVSCAHKPVVHEVSLGQGAQGQDGHYMAGSGEVLRTGERISGGYVASPSVSEDVKIGRACATIEHKRRDAKTGKYRTIHTDFSCNVKTTAGTDRVFANAYSTSPSANGMNYVLCSNDAVTETSASTTLSNEITTNGLARAQGTYAHTAGQATATIAKTFTCATAPQSVQKCALSDSSSGGTVTHILGFTQRALQVGDQLAITFTITISALEDSSPYRWAANDNGWNDLFAWKQDELELAA